MSLRNLQEECSQKFHLVIFGGEKLIQLKYSTGVHSYFNTFDQKMIPNPSFEEWQEKFSSLLPQAYSAIHSITGGYSKLTEYCLKQGATTKEETKEILDESSWKSDSIAKIIYVCFLIKMIWVMLTPIVIMSCYIGSIGII